MLGIIALASGLWAQEPERTQLQKPFAYREPVVGFVKQQGNQVVVDTPERRYFVRKDEFLALNKLTADAKNTQAHYVLPDKGVLKIELKSPEYSSW